MILGSECKMIGVIFQFHDEFVDVRINGNEIYFRKNGIFSTIEGLKLSRHGVIKEFPDLTDNEDWKFQAIQRFKENFKSLKTEKEKVEYVVEDLKKFGYKPVAFQKQGFRAKRIK